MFCPECGKTMIERDDDFYCLRDDLLIDKTSKKKIILDHTTQKALNRLDESLRTKLVKWYHALYIDGYAYLETDECFIYVFDDFVRVSIGGIRGSGVNSVERPTFEFSVKYDDMKALFVTQEREITSLRTFLIGPVLAAWFKDRTLILNMSFTDSLGLLENPCFKLAKPQLDECYRFMIERIAESRGKKLQEVVEHGGKQYSEIGKPWEPMSKTNSTKN